MPGGREKIGLVSCGIVRRGGDLGDFGAGATKHLPVSGKLINYQYNRLYQNMLQQ